MLFGPAYKGITLAAAVAIELARLGRNVPFAYNRKEAKDHGEGGTLVGAPLAGRVLIVDDVISAGTSVRESIALIAGAGAHALWRGDRAGPPGEGHRGRRGRAHGRRCSTSRQQTAAAGGADCDAGRLVAVSEVHATIRRCRCMPSRCSATANATESECALTAASGASSLAALLLLGSAVAMRCGAQAQAAPASAAGIYTCVDDKGRRLTSDRPIAECIDRSSACSTRTARCKRVVPPTLTADERAEKEARERKAAAEARARRPTPCGATATCWRATPTRRRTSKAREAALDDVRSGDAATRKRA